MSADYLYILSVILIFLNVTVICENLDEENENARYTIEGKVFLPENSQNDWESRTKILVNGGLYRGFLKEDGTFAISNIPSGSYILEAVNPNYMYEPVRVEINSKGKFRARKVNHIQTSQIIQVPYPLRLKTLGKFRYFQVREQWKITDFLFNPMILMMVLPLLLIMVLPKMMNDPETKKEMEQLSSFTKMSDMPEMSEVITSFLNRGQPAKAKSIKEKKKRQ